MKIQGTLRLAVLSLLLTCPSAWAEFQRGYVSIVGSSTVVPFADAVAKRIAKSGKVHAPLVQGLGTGGALKLFCENLGPESPDIALASREMKPREKEECKKNGVDVTELQIGYDALILAQSRKAEPWFLSGKEVRLAFAKWIASGDKMDLNPNKLWKDVNPKLPAAPIEVLGPPKTSSTHDAFIDLISELECKHEPWVPQGVTEPNPDLIRKCRSLREDNVYHEGRENDLDQVAQIATSQGSPLGIVGFKIYTENADKIRAIPIDGVVPTFDSISSNAYIGTRPLYLYLKNAHINQTPGFQEFLSEFMNERAWGDKGYLRNEGLVTMPSTERSSNARKLEAFGVYPSTSASADSAPKKESKAKAKSKK